MFVQPQQISPAESYQISYFIRNHTDATTYYVRARVYDVRTGELLDTLNLEQASTNSRLFLKTATAPADPNGYGRSIVAIATVYTDSGYTTKSETYEEQEQYFLVKAPTLVGAGGGFIDLKGLKDSLSDMIDEKLKNLPKPDPLPALPFDALFGAIGVLQREINRIPKELPDGQPLMEQIAAIKKAIEALPSPEKLDLTPVLTKLDELKRAISDVPKTLEEQFPGMTSEAKQEMQKAAAEFLQTLEKVFLPQMEKHMQEFIGTRELSIPIASLIRPTKRPQVDEPAPDLSHLM